MAGDVSITITAQNLSQPQLDQLTRSLGQVERSGQRASRGVMGVGEAVQRGTAGLERGYSILTRLDLVQITLTQSTERVEQAQENYNQAVANFGPASKQATDASRQLEAAQAGLEKAQARARLSTLLIVGDVVTLAVQIPRAVQALSAMRVAMLGTAAAGATMNVALTGGLAAIGIVAGYFAVSQAIRGTGTAADVSGQSLSVLQERLRAVEHDLPILKDLQHAPSLSRVFEVVPGKHSPGETYRIALKEAQSLREEIALLEAQQAEYVEAEARRAAIIAGNEQVIRSEIDASIARLQDYDAQLRQPLGLEAREQVSFQYDREREQLEALQGALHEVEQSTVRAANALLGSAPGFAQLSISMQAAVAAAAGIDGTLVPAIERVVNFEALLASQSGETRGALLEQAAAVTDKSGKHQVLDELLQRGAITEREYQAAVDASAAALARQSGAATTAATTTDNLASALFGRGASPGSLGNMGGPLGSGSMEIPSGMGNVQSLDRVVNREAKHGTRAIDLIDEELQLAVQRQPGLLGDPNVQAYFKNVQTLRGKQYSHLVPRYQGLNKRVANAREGILPLIAAAEGFHGDVSQPTMMLVGERGSERVDVTPGGRGAGGGTMIVNNYLSPGTDVREVTRAVARAYDIQKRRIASRRST